MIQIDINKQLYGSNGDMELSVKLNIKKGDFIALTGQSGSGKTTLLRILAGLEEANGSIKIDDEYWLNNKILMPPQKRQIGFVFQDYALFSNMSVKENLLYVNKDIKLANHLLQITNLTKLENRLPNTLSGGQKQRVSLCRAMMNKPKLLLMDEPLSALDLNMRTKLQNEILILHKEFKTTTIMVTHDPSEIYRLSNRVVVLNHGKIIKNGKTKDVFLKTKEGKNFSFEGKLLDIQKDNFENIAILSIDQQLVEVVVSDDELKNLKIGSTITVSTRGFTPMIS